ncbi:MAG: hypothetical protein WBF58_08835 [Xanthobacteraceae bacterium]
MPNLPGNGPVLGLGGTLDRSPQIRIDRNGNLLAAILRLRHVPILALLRGTVRGKIAQRNAPIECPISRGFAAASPLELRMAIVEETPAASLVFARKRKMRAKPSMRQRGVEEPSPPDRAFRVISA